MTSTLPPPRRDDGPYRVAFVCLGNICRSPMAAVVFAAKVAAGDLEGRVSVDSSGTGDWHIGDPMDHRAAATLTSAGYDATLHRAQQFDPAWFDAHDLIVVMDSSNRGAVEAMAPDPASRGRVRMLRDFDADAAGESDVPDPYYGGQRGFDDVLAIVERLTDRLADDVAALLTTTA